MNINILWRRIGDDFYLPETAHQLETALIHYERETFSQLHYGRRTFYHIHDRNRLDRMDLIPLWMHAENKNNH